MQLLIISACGSGLDVPDGPSEPEVAGYLQLTVSTAGNPGSRATADSEDGNGREPGNENESAIHDLTVFAYTDLGEGLDGRNRIIWDKYITASNTNIEDENPSLPLNRIYYIKIPLNSEDFQALRVAPGILRCAVVANAGDLTNRFDTLSDLTFSTDSYQSAWIQEDNDVSSAKQFVMSSAFNGAKRSDGYRNDGRIYSHQSNDEGIVYYGEVTLERVAARIDLQFSTDEREVKRNDDKTLTYAVKDVDHTVTLLNVIPVNVMKQNSYLFKHVSGRNVESHDGNSGHYIASDETRTDALPDNYVYCPSFFGQIPASVSTLESWFGNTRVASVKANPSYYQDTGSMEIYGDPFEADGKKTVTITYANENSHHKSVQMSGTANGGTFHPSDYLTGLLFRAQYHPAIVYTNGDCSETRPYEDGDDFWLFRTVSSDVKEAENRYFHTLAALNDYIATLAAGGKYETVKYNGGICYYNIWVKHNSLDHTDENYPMKYGIVRNNIYRINLSFHGIGQPTPEIAEPYGVVPRIYVVKWNFRPQPEIIM